MACEGDNQGDNFGTFDSPAECGPVANAAGCSVFMFATAYRSWGCRCCTNPTDAVSYGLWSLYDASACLPVPISPPLPPPSPSPSPPPPYGEATYYDGPHASMYLAGYASDGGTQHASQDAAEAACTADAACGGVTMAGDGSFYTTRAGTTLLSSPSGETSWLKSTTPPSTPPATTDGPAPGWYDAGADTSCDDGCAAVGLMCTEEAMHANHGDVDTSEEVLALIAAAGGTTTATSCEASSALATPLWREGLSVCLYHASGRDISNVDCDFVAGPTGEDKHRLCYCHAAPTDAPDSPSPSPPEPSPSPPASSSYQEFWGLHCGGGNLALGDGYGDDSHTDVDECKALCDASPECTGFIQDWKFGKCSYWMKGTLNPARRYSGGHICHKKCDGPCPDMCWVRLPTGCSQEMWQTNTPTVWFTDTDNEGSACQSSRLDDYNGLCEKSDAENHWGPSAPAAGID